MEQTIRGLQQWVSRRTGTGTAKIAVLWTRAVNAVRAKWGAETAGDAEGLCALRAEIRAVNRALTLAQARFDQTADSDLTDACIYEINALHARHRYLLGQAKKIGLSDA